MRTYLRVADVACASGDDRTLALVTAWLAPHLPPSFEGLAESIAALLDVGQNDSARSAWRYLRTVLAESMARGEMMTTSAAFSA